MSFNPRALTERTLKGFVDRWVRAQRAKPCPTPDQWPPSRAACQEDIAQLLGFATWHEAITAIRQDQNPIATTVPVTPYPSISDSTHDAVLFTTYKPLLFTSTKDANENLSVFNITVQAMDDNAILVSGWTDWIMSEWATKGIFPTLAHLSAEWALYVSTTLEDARKNTLLFNRFRHSTTPDRAELLNEMTKLYSTGSVLIEEIVRGEKTLPHTIPLDWRERLTKALSPPNNGAAFFHGSLCSFALEVDVEAMKIHQQQLIQHHSSDGNDQDSV